MRIDIDATTMPMYPRLGGVMTDGPKIKCGLTSKQHKSTTHFECPVLVETLVLAKHCFWGEFAHVWCRHPVRHPHGNPRRSLLALMHTVHFYILSSGDGPMKLKMTVLCVALALAGAAVQAKTFKWTSASDIPTWDIHSQNNALANGCLLYTSRCV